MNVPINDLKQLATKRNLTHVIVWAFDADNVQHVATYGKTVEQCSQAADFGNKLKVQLGWPESLQAQPSRVRKLEREIAELNKALALKLDAMPSGLSAGQSKKLEARVKELEAQLAAQNAELSHGGGK